MTGVGDRTLKLFDNSKSGPLSDSEIHNIRMAALPYLLDTDRRSNLALLITRLIETIDASRPPVRPAVRPICIP